MKFCTHCGKELFDEAVICPGCGCATGTAPVAAAPAKQDLLTKLSERVKTNGIIWIVIAIIQIIIGLCGTWLPLIVGVVGSIYYFVALRGFVMENKNAFLALEQNVNTTAF